MPVFKIVGSLLLLVCGLALPRFFVVERERERTQLSSLSALVLFFKRQIERYRLPQSEILARYDGVLFGAAEGKTDSLSALFGSTNWYCREAEELAMRFAKSHGSGYYAEELAFCDEILASIADVRRQKENEEEKKAKTERLLSLAGAALLIILLL